MKSRYITHFPVKYRLKLVYLYFFLAVALAGGMCAVAVMSEGMSDRHRNIMADATLPGARYAGHSLTAVDLSASGLAGEIARQLAGHIMELEAAHMMDSSNFQTRSRWNIIPIVTVLILLVLTVWAWLR